MSDLGWDTKPGPPLPSVSVIAYLEQAVAAEIHAYEQAVAAEIHAYVCAGGGRNFRHEDLQEAARDYLRALGSWSA